MKVFNSGGNIWNLSLKRGLDRAFQVYNGGNMQLGLCQ